MCGIAFIKAKDAPKVFDYQHTRGTDGVGIILNSLEVYKRFAVSLKRFVKEGSEVQFYFHGELKGEEKVYKTYPEMYKAIVASALMDIDEEEMVLLHHRKKSSGGVASLDSTHPFEGKKFILVQNGTSVEFRHWGTVEGIDESMPDTMCMEQYLESKCKTLEECAFELTRISDASSLGVIVIVDKKTKKILLWTDGDREIYIDIEGEKVNYFSSKKPNDSYQEYKAEGNIIIDFKGNIISNNLSEFNKTKKPAVNYGSNWHSNRPAPVVLNKDEDETIKGASWLELVNQANKPSDKQDYAKALNGEFGFKIGYDISVVSNWVTARIMEIRARNANFLSNFKKQFDKLSDKKEELRVQLNAKEISKNAYKREVREAEKQLLLLKNVLRQYYTKGLGELQSDYNATYIKVPRPMQTGEVKENIDKIFFLIQELEKERDAYFVAYK